MKIDPNAPAFVERQGMLLPDRTVVHTTYGLPIRLELARSFEAALLTNLAALRRDGFKDDAIEEFALIRADALIAAYNEGEK